MSGPCYVVAGTKSWNRRIFEEKIARLPGQWVYIGARQGLTSEQLAALAPRYVFFLHWSWKVPDEIVSTFECVCFHMTDVPYGRGGSPLQNLIVRGHTETKLSALRMVEEMDAGPVYAKVRLDLSGAAEEIYQRATVLSADLIRQITEERPEPVPQAGEPTVFRRRRPSESRMGAAESLEHLYDFIRMLDAEGYPRAFLDHAGFRLEFSRAVLYDGRIDADVVIRKVPREDDA